MYMSDVRIRKMSPGPSFSLCLATLLLFLLQVISKRPAAVSISLSLSACPIYTSPYMVTVHILLHVCSDSNIVVSGVPCVVVTCVIRPSSWRQRQGGGGTTNMKRGKWVRLRMIEKEKTEYPVDEKHWLEKPERNSQRAVMAGVLNLYLLLMHAVSPPFGWNCEITRSLTAAGMLRALVSALGQH